MPCCPLQSRSIWSWYTRSRASPTAASISGTSRVFHPLTAYSYMREEIVTSCFVRGCRSDWGTLPFCFHLEVADQTKPCVLACSLDTYSRCTNIFSWQSLSSAWGTPCVSVDPQFGLEETNPLWRFTHSQRRKLTYSRNLTWSELLSFGQGDVGYFNLSFSQLCFQSPHIS